MQRALRQLATKISRCSLRKAKNDTAHKKQEFFQGKSLLSFLKQLSCTPDCSLRTLLPWRICIELMLNNLNKSWVFYTLSNIRKIRGQLLGLLSQQPQPMAPSEGHFESDMVESFKVALYLGLDQFPQQFTAVMVQSEV